MKLFGGIPEKTGKEVKPEKGGKSIASGDNNTPDNETRYPNLNLTRTIPSSDLIEDCRQFSDNCDLEPLFSPALEEMPNWNILPSYQLYQSTFSKSIDPSLEEHLFDPPTYEYVMSPQSTPEESTSEEVDYFSRDSRNNLPSEPTMWENSILGNTHKLKSVADYNKEIANSVDIRIFLTNTPCQVGIAPSIINPQEFEFSQGDTIHGFFYITNKSKNRISFDMISAVFEGRISVMGDSNDTKKPIVFNKFLNMFDYCASWTPAYWNNIATSVDPIDQSVVLFPEERYFEPGITYKKTFSFKIPYRLLDSACANDVSSHIELIPSFGLEREQFINNLRRQREVSTQTLLEPSQKQKLGESKVFRVKELSFPDTSVSYSVIIRIIGKSSHYSGKSSSISSQKEEYVILNYSSCYIRVIPRNLYSNEENLAKQKEASLFSKYYIKQIKDVIVLGNERLQSTPDKEKTIENQLKSRQLYHNTSQGNMILKYKDIHEDLKFEVFHPFKKKILGSSKIIGSIKITTPNMVICMNYIHPPKFKSFAYLSYKMDLPNSIDIPMKLTLHFGNKKNPSSKGTILPSIKSVSARLVVITFRSKKYPIPIEITNELLFKNIPGDDNIETHLVKPFKMYLQEISKIIGVVNPTSLNVNRQLIMDIKSLASLSTKYNYLKFDKVSISQNQLNADWIQKTSSNSSEEVYEKNIDIKLDLLSLLTKEQFGQSEALKDPITLVPDFQGCIIGRKYYVEIIIKMNNNDQYSIKLPSRITA